MSTRPRQGLDESLNYTFGNVFDNYRVFERHILGTELEFGEDWLA